MRLAYIAAACLSFALFAGLIYPFAGDSGGSSGSYGSGASNSGQQDSGGDSAQEIESGRTQERERVMERENESNGSGRNLGAMMRNRFNGRDLPCGENATMRERVRCRLSVKEDGDRLDYVPEECREIANEANRTACFGLYDNVQKCRRMEGNGERFACVRGKLGMNGTVNATLTACRKSENPVACVATLRAQVLSLSKFKLYNLEETAEGLVGKGLDRAQAEAFIAKLEQLKLDFNNASTMEAKKGILQDALLEWRQFKKDAMESIIARGGTVS